jgi:hypothetical protein
MATPIFADFEARTEEILRRATYFYVYFVLGLRGSR